jgi:uncharacterized membrane protein YcaP (DUF421 family)
MDAVRWRKAFPMWHEMFVMQIPVLEKVLRTVLVYALIVILFRVAGKRDLASLSTFDFVVMFLLSNVVQNAVIGSDDSLLGGAIGAVTLLAVNAVLNRWVATSDRASRLLEGSATTVIDDGQVLSKTLRRLALRPSDLEHAVRVQNGDDLGEIQTGRLEPNGQLVITLKLSEQNASKSDIADLHARLDAISAALTSLTTHRTS